VRKFLVVLLAAALLAGYYYLGTGYLRQRQEKDRLAVETVAAQQALAALTPRPADLDQRLKQALDSQEAARNLLPGRMDTTEALNVILRLAEDSGVKAIPLVTQPWTTETAGSYEYSIFRFELNVSGEFVAVQAFLARLESNGPGTLVAEYLRLARPDGQPDSDFVEALLRVALYARPLERH
jgi:hypothetical protein